MIKKILNKFKNSKIAKNSLWMITSTIIQMVLSLFVNMIVARYLGTTNYGILNYGLSFINFFMGICTLGLNTITIKYLVNEKDNQGQIIGSCIGMRIISSVISIFMILMLVILLKSNDKLIIITTFLQSLSLLFETFTVINLWYQHKLKSKYTAIVTLIAYVIMTIYRVILVLLKKNVIWFAISHCVSSLVIAILLIILYKKHNGPKFSFSLSKSKELLSQSYHFILASLMVAVYAQTDKIMIGSMIDDISAVGLYTVSTTIVSLWSFLPSTIISSFQPVILEYKKTSTERYNFKLKQLYSIIIWLSLLYTLFIFVFGKYIILILYGSDYLGGLAPLKIAIFSVTFSYIGCVRESWLVFEGKQKYAKWFSLIGALSNIVLNVILIPSYGIVGAAIATAIAQISTAIIAPLIFSETRVCIKHLFDGLLLKYYKFN